MHEQHEVVFRGKRFDVVRGVFSGHDGKLHTREWVEHAGAVTIVPVLDDGRVCLIKNYRQAVSETLVELPAGTREPDEDPLETARRELTEETGYSAKRLELVHEFFMSPGILNERMFVYLATGLSAGNPAREAGEQIENLIVPWEEAVTMAADGRIHDAKSLVGILVCDRLLASREKENSNDSLFGPFGF